MRHLYLTSGVFSPSAGGVGAADNLCNADSAKPSTGTYKALLASSTRRACVAAGAGSDAGPDCTAAQHLDWPLRASSEYVLPNGGAFFTTSANAIVEHYPTPGSFDTGINFWSGFGYDWTSFTQTCHDWTSNSASERGKVGWGQTYGADWLFGGDLPCSGGQPLVCVEQ